MVYDWEGKRDICYKMYIEEKKALEDIMEYMRTFHHFAPSKRAFQTQFKRWGFPSKQNPAHKNADLVARIKQLWERNTSQRDMLRILNEEGFAIKERELMRVRAKNRWLLRVPNGMKSQSIRAAETTQLLETDILGLQRGGLKPDGSFVNDEQLVTPNTPILGDVSPRLPPQVIAKRQERFERLQIESAERWATKKRRRRTRGWAGLPADPPGPPRFPSETTIDDSKRYLRLENSMYREVRDHFQRICEEAGFIKKTIAGPERWQAAKDRLIQESPHLQAIFWADPSELESKALALDVVCTDVTKRMRTLERRMTIAEAKNVLGINPEESRQIRNAFYDTLKADHFTSKLEAGDDHWRELKDKWIQGSELLRRIVSSDTATSQQGTKFKAIEVLCRDVMKRLRDDQTKRDPSRKRAFRTNSTQKPQVQNMSPCSKGSDAADYSNDNFSNGISTLASQALASAPMVSDDAGGMQIDPSLLQAANDPTFGISSSHRHDDTQQLSYDPLLHPSLIPTPVYIHIHPQSRQIYENPEPWLEKLSVRSLNELQRLVSSRLKISDNIALVEGIEPGDDGHKFPLAINNDHELDEYLTHIPEGEANFVIHLQ